MDKGKPFKKSDEKLTASFTASKKKPDVQKLDRASANHLPSKKRKDEDSSDSIPKLNAKKIKKDQKFPIVPSTSKPNVKKIKKEDNALVTSVSSKSKFADNRTDDFDVIHDVHDDRIGELFSGPPSDEGEDDDDIDRLFGGPMSEDEQSSEEGEEEAIRLDPELGKKLWFMEAEQIEYPVLSTPLSKLKSGNSSQDSRQPRCLVDLCVETIGNNLDMLDRLGSAPLHLLQPALSRANAKQLKRLENTSPAFKAISNKYWIELCLKHFPEQRDSYIYKKGNHDKEYERLEREKSRKQKELEAKTKLLGQHSRERYRKLQEEKERKKTKFLDISSLPSRRNPRASKTLVQKIWDRTPRMSFAAPMRPATAPKMTRPPTSDSGGGPIRSTFRSVADRHQRTTGSSSTPLPPSRTVTATTRLIVSQNRPSLANSSSRQTTSQSVQRPNSQLGQSRMNASPASTRIRQTVRAAPFCQETPRKRPINNSSSSSRSSGGTKAEVDKSFFNRVLGGKK